MEGGRFHTLNSCTTKAICAASNKRPTTKGAVGQDLDWSHAIWPERWTAIEGGMPVLISGECIGVSGGDGEIDVHIAKTAVESIDASWQSRPARDPLEQPR